MHNGPWKLWQWSDKNTCIIAVHEGVPSFGHISDFLVFFIFIYFFIWLYSVGIVLSMSFTIHACMHTIGETAERCDHIRENIIL